MQSCQSDFPPSFQDYSIHPRCHTQSVLEESVFAHDHKYLLTLHFPAAPESYHSSKTALLNLGSLFSVAFITVQTIKAINTRYRPPLQRPSTMPAKRFATLRRQHRHLPPSTLRNIPETHLAEHRCSERFRHTQGHPIAEKSGLPAGRLRCIFVTVTGRAGVRSCRTERHDHCSHFITPDTQARYKLPSPPYRCNIFVTQT